MHKRILKQLTLVLSCALCCDAMAIAPGFYMGLMGGPATNSATEQPIQVYPLPTAAPPNSNTIANTGLANPKSTQFGSRFYMGYKINQLAGFEFGLDYFSTIKYILTNSTLQPTGGTDLRLRGVDLVGKLDYSFRNTVGVFGKAGVTAVYITTPGGLNVTNYRVITTYNRNTKTTSTKIVDAGSNTYSSKLAPTFTVGVSYDMTQNWQMEASAMSLLVGGYIKTMTLYSLGLSYHFVDTYCGQFLC